MGQREATGIVFECDACNLAEMVLDGNKPRGMVVMLGWAENGMDHQVAVYACRKSHVGKAVKNGLTDYYDVLNGATEVREAVAAVKGDKGKKVNA